MRPFIIDTDGGSDDVVALIMALRHADIDVLAMTTVGGNVEVERATRNTLYTAQLCDSDVPVYAGCDRPLVVPPSDAKFFHGEDGLGDRGFPAPERSAEPTPAVDFLIETVRATPGCVLVTLGPLTNIATALRRVPEMADHVDRCVVMGGAACAVGNITPAAEFNLWVDPHAAYEVFASDLPVEMVGWELCRAEANLDDDEMAELRALGTPLADFALDCNATAIETNRRWLGDPGLALPDPVAMAVALEPEVVVRRAGHHHVEIEVESPLTRGMSVVDVLGVRNLGARTSVVWEIDVPRFKTMLRVALES